MTAVGDSFDSCNLNQFVAAAVVAAVVAVDVVDDEIADDADFAEDTVVAVDDELVTIAYFLVCIVVVEAVVVVVVVVAVEVEVVVLRIVRFDLIASLVAEWARLASRQRY